MSNVAAVILCHDEVVNIRHCIESVQAWCDVFVVDSGSTDGTLSICGEYTKNIVHHPYTSHAEQWQWALDNLPISAPWILALDADFVVTPELKRQIQRDVPTVPGDVDGIYVRHRYVFGWGPIRFGGTKQYWLRLIRRGRAKPDLSDLVDFRFNVMGRTQRFDSSVIEYNRHDDDISTWIRKQDKFSLRLAVEEELRRANAINWSGKPRFFGNSDQRFMYLRNLWQRFPLFVRPALYYFYRYFLMLGFLDGRAGFLYHTLQGFWLRVIVDWKIFQLRQFELSLEQLLEVKRLMFSTRDGSVSGLARQIKAVQLTSAGERK